MALQIKRGPTEEPIRIYLLGLEGVGKTTWASQCPNTLTITAEDGGGDLDYARFVAPSWVGLRNTISSLIDDPQGVRTVAIDTIDKYERLVHASICEQERAETIEAVGGGFGKGYTRATEMMSELSTLLDELRRKRRMNVIIIGHTHVKTFNDPGGHPYDRYEPRVHKGAAAVWKAWADCVLFACYEAIVKTATRKAAADVLAKGKADGGKRVMYTTMDPAYDAKNRYNLPEELPLQWAAFSKAIRWDERDAKLLGNVVKTPKELYADLQAKVGEKRAQEIVLYLRSKDQPLGPDSHQLESDPAVDAFVAEAKDKFLKAFFPRWNELCPPPTQKAGNTKEEVEKAQADIDENRRAVVKAWYGVDSLTDVPIAAQLGKHQFNTTSLRQMGGEAFRTAVDAVLGAAA